MAVDKNKQATYHIEGKEPEIRKVYKPSDYENQVLQHTYTRYYQMKDNRAKYDKDWEKKEKQWDSFRPPKDTDDWRSDIYVPMTASIIEAELSEIINQELKPWVVARGSEDEPKAMVMNSILDFTWDIAKSDMALYHIIRDALIFGTGIGMEYYWREPRTIRGDKKKNGEHSERKVLEYDDCYLEPIRIWDFYPDERARGFTGPHAARDCVRRHIMDYDDFRAFFTGKQWDPMGNAKLVKPGGDNNYYEFYKPPERVEHDREVEVLWYWNKPDDLLSIVANDIQVVMKPNPYKHKQLPFVRTVDVEKGHQFYGKGETDLLESLQEEVNTLRRMIIDRNHLDIDKPILVSDTLTIEDEDVMARPHGIIPVGDVNAAKPLEYSDIPQSVFKSLEMLYDDRIRITGMDERQQSVAQAGTATEAAILKEATLKRLNMKIWRIKNDTIVDIGRLRVANIMQFYSIPKLEEVIGEAMLDRAEKEGLVIKKEGTNFTKSYRNIRLEDQKIEIDPRTNQPTMKPHKGSSFFEAKPAFFLPTRGGYDITYKATSSIPLSKPLQQQKADEMYDRLAGNPTVDPWKLAEYLLKSREEDPDNFKMQEQQQSEEESDASLQQMVDLAGMENDEMIKGNEVGPTPYAPPFHTQMHIEFMRSKKFKEEIPTDDNKITQIFSNHVTGEIIAQQAREAGGPQGLLGGEGQSPQPGGPPMPGGGEMGMEDVAPGRMMGGENVPSGIQGPRSGVQVGRKV